ncbi:TPA: TIR domain-containing protein [Pasteurella multocida]|uniref:TIR domain-containing protein n=1 Tax=Pasteurella multocida TaxID=747 RepID=UPI002944C919|nr:TIR domain-containing protein [Pasteurella multocida]MEE3747533.1 TIR domain-containing protein [Pasteurella multocida]HDR0998961.1 TIR domain-containing protein [Pasteurella multocida]HDR1012823.1 TIR domain-containing protein [Pasteurella multocida]HDR1014344.1 TIR domain-containing protein [Pasteurella multocida]
MGRKIFISYKYSDSSVKRLYPYQTATARDYVDILQNNLERDGIHINKGEKDNESLAQFKDETIQTKLSDKIFDSSVTIVLLSPNMKDMWAAEEEQWIPWEIAYSLKNKKRALSSSKRNAILLVALPDLHGSYTYADNLGFYFKIIQQNRNNLKYSYPAKCLNNGCSDSYMLKCNWDNFISNVNGWINAAVEIKEHADQYIINTKI